MNKFKNYIPLLIMFVGSVLLGYIIGWAITDTSFACPGDKELTLQTLGSSPAEKAQFCADLIPQEPMIVTEYVPRYINTICPVCDCSGEVSVAIIECIDGYEQFMPVKKKPCKGLECKVRVYRGSK